MMPCMIVRGGRIPAFDFQGLRISDYTADRDELSSSLARIEVAQSDIDRIFDKTTRDAIVKRFKEVGFNYVSLDLQGFRTGSLNEVLPKKAV